MAAARTGVVTIALIVATGSLVSCGGGTEPQPESTLVSLAIPDSAVTVEAGFSRHLTAVPRYTSAPPPSGVAVDWSTDHPEIAAVTAGTVLGIAAGTAHVTASAGSVIARATVTVIPTIVVSLALSRTHAALSPGRTLQLAAVPRDALGRPIPGRVVTFASSDTIVAQVGADGTITARTDGAALIGAYADSASAGLLLSVIEPTPVSFGVIGVAPSGVTPPASFTMTLRASGDSLVLAGPAGVRGQLAGTVTLADTVEFAVQADSVFAASSLFAPVEALPASVPVVLVPRAVSINAGSFAGRTVPISVTAAVQPCAIVSDPQCGAGFGFYTSAFRTGVTAWDSFPIPVNPSGFSDGDTAAIWDGLRAMEAAVGRPLFTPVASMGNGIAVSPGLPPGVTGNVGGYAQWSWDASGRILTAHVWFPARPTRTLVEHEFLHALGFGHTCSWPSPMGGYGCPSVQMSAEDVAYLTLARAVFEAERPLLLPTGRLPCGYMGLLAAAATMPIVVSCDGDDWPPLPDPLPRLVRPSPVRTSAMP